jgi:hypothetical protein
MLLGLTFCRDNSRNKREAFKPNTRMLSYDQKLVFSVDSLEKMSREQMSKLDSDELSPATDTVLYLEDKIYISCLRVATGCAEYQGDIKFLNDTLKIHMHLIGDQVCAEQDAWRVRFVVENKEQKRYIIRKYL